MSHYPEDKTETTKSIELTHPNVNISDHIPQEEIPQQTPNYEQEHRLVSELGIVAFN